ncbi:hypothetical protein [Blautia obeum]|uniref:hypothetical protein n=1 Tax=Blautia obeum TaxID=40520 RepID=UPI0011C39C8E|nr:hypothetical protein [Blautia obeum]
MEKLKEEIINKLEKALKDAVVWAKLITTENSTQNKTRIINAEYHLSQFLAYMEVLWELDIDKYVEIGSETNKDRTAVALAIDKLYEIGGNENENCKCN